MILHTCQISLPNYSQPVLLRAVGLLRRWGLWLYEVLAQDLCRYMYIKYNNGDEEREKKKKEKDSCRIMARSQNDHENIGITSGRKGMKTEPITSSGFNGVLLESKKSESSSMDLEPPERDKHEMDALIATRRILRSDDGSLKAIWPPTRCRRETDTLMKWQSKNNHWFFHYKMYYSICIVKGMNENARR